VADRFARAFHEVQVAESFISSFNVFNVWVKPVCDSSCSACLATSQCTCHSLWVDVPHGFSSRGNATMKIHHTDLGPIEITIYFGAVPIFRLQLACKIKKPFLGMSWCAEVVQGRRLCTFGAPASWLWQTLHI
jgi:hypothetical protein